MSVAIGTTGTAGGCLAEDLTKDAIEQLCVPLRRVRRAYLSFCLHGCAERC